MSAQDQRCARAHAHGPHRFVESPAALDDFWCPGRRQVIGDVLVLCAARPTLTGVGVGPTVAGLEVSAA